MHASIYAKQSYIKICLADFLISGEKKNVLKKKEYHCTLISWHQIMIFPRKTIKRQYVNIEDEFSNINSGTELAIGSFIIDSYLCNLMSVEMRREFLRNMKFPYFSLQIMEHYMSQVFISLCLGKSPCHNHFTISIILLEL